MSVLEITKENYEDEVVKSDKPVLIDFWAPWCGPCRMILLIIEELSNENSTAKFGKVNVDRQPELAQMFSIRSIPTLVVIKNGEMVNRIVGVRPKAVIEEMLNS